MKSLEITKLQKNRELEKVGGNIKDIIEIFLNAINDWPNSILKLEDYELEVRNFIGGDVTKNKLKECLSNIDFSKNAWQAESLSQLIDVYQFYDNDVTLTEIMKDLETKLESKNIV